ncbi:hypothetical protein C8R46DRAFT_1103680 [Mycena filopes]|nr:hypothetical protein C8R46DRAFT_1103680 [Mycena filopes]
MSTLSSPPPTEALTAAHDQLAHLMSLVADDPKINSSDRKTLQGFYNELEEKRLGIDQDTGYDIPDDEAQVSDDEGQSDDDEAREIETQQAIRFSNFLASLDPSEDVTKMILQGRNRVAAALTMVENGANFLANTPMQKILEMYEGIQAREATLSSDPDAVSMVNAKIYVAEATAFSNTVQTMIIVDMKAVAESVDNDTA